MKTSHGQVLVIDCSVSGISGDMILGALVDLGIDSDGLVILREIGNYVKGVKSIDVEVKDVKKHGFRAKKVEVKAEEDCQHRTGEEIRRAILEFADDHLSPDPKNFAMSVIDTLLEAESRVHGEEIEELYLHELGSVDTLVDIIGSAILFQKLKLFENTRVYSTPVALGGGLFETIEGKLSSPSPATLEILKRKNFIVKGGPVDGELCTPTGAAILVNIAEPLDKYPLFKPTSIGYGAGSKDLDCSPNILRVILGEPISNQISDEVVVLETNVDDLSGEVLGYTLDRLMEEGAKNVSIIPMYTKNNRPGSIIQVITKNEQANKIIKVLMEETGSLGVRVVPCTRHVFLRDFENIDLNINGIKKTIKVKVARDETGRIIRLKPEYKDAVKLAKETGVPLREIFSIAEEKARAYLKKVKG